LLLTHAKAGARIDLEHLERCYPEASHGSPNPNAGPLLWEAAPLREAVEAFERQLIRSRLELYGGDGRAARESLGLTKSTFHRYLKALEIDAAAGADEDERS
jgi:two-component system nitrogen regulation response regulator NtrX